MSSGSPDGAATLASSAKEDEGLPPPSASDPSSPTNKQENLPSAVEFEPPLACVRRILKHALPSSTNVGKDASAAFARATGIFIIYLTSCANDFARENKRQTITANDVLAATKELDFEEFIPEMQTFLENYRAMEKSKKDAKAKAAADKAGKPKENEADDDEDDENESHDEADDHDDAQKRGHDELADGEADDEAAEPVAKKAKGDDEESNEPAASDLQQEETAADADMTEGKAENEAD